MTRHISTILALLTVGGLYLIGIVPWIFFGYMLGRGLYVGAVAAFVIAVILFRIGSVITRRLEIWVETE